MKATISFENTISNDVSIMIDALRASTTITVALNNYDKVIPAFSPDDAIEKSKKYDGVLAGERKGKMIEGFDIGNSPSGILDYKSNKKNLILTSSNGTRVLENMNSKHVLIGCFLNAKACAKVALELSKSHIDIVMAGWLGEFTIEDYLAGGEILYWLKYFAEKEDIDINFSEFAEVAILGSRDLIKSNEAISRGFSAKRLKNVCYSQDVSFCLKRNVLDVVGIYEKGIITKF
ncbi:2-phosphosulfolactate phosphatase [Methanobrevibacter sp. 87.7]|uniref:2-phosphosulfolactate phosphatase n=1 Tax=Methanobrevibacter sp. 87.7 TaxID=387957 RepID=UPI000B5069CA|nr:2-phosphosulfolactate phosphatase [Methanobrevibacter sp. 87.7]OWT32336.1 2-phosphosulfolactate phosphatase [Methanobrevibacter sp. 87.7]